MALQVCPKCAGNGTEEENATCRICQGKGLIDQETGNPPQEPEQQEEELKK